ncbi:MAG: hypothetical protein WCL14_14935 [Bacteroidota bacterium]
MKTYASIVGIFLTGLIFTVLIGCKKDTPNVIPTILVYSQIGNKLVGSDASGKAH